MAQTLSGTPGTYTTIGTLAEMATADFLKPDLLDGIAYIEPSQNTMLALTRKAMKGGSIAAKASAYQQIVDYPFPRQVTCASVAAANTTTIVLQQTGAYLRYKRGQTFRFPSTGEIIRLTEDPTSNTLANVQRGLGGNAAPYAAGTALHALATVVEEGGLLASPVNSYPGYRTRYVEHVQTAVQITDLGKSNQTWANQPELVRIEGTAAKKFARDQNTMLMWGVPSQTAMAITNPTATGQLFIAGGAYYFARRNHFNRGPIIGYDDLQAFGQAIMYVGDPTQKRIHTDSVMISQIDKLAVSMNLARQPSSQEALDLKIRTIAISGFGGTIEFVLDLELEEERKRTGFSTLLALDYGEMQMVTLAKAKGGRITQLPENTGAYNEKHVWHEYIGLNVKREEALGRFVGIKAIREAA
jgi:hypothetical protein